VAVRKDRPLWCCFESLSNSCLGSSL